MNLTDVLVIITVGAPLFGFLINGLFGRSLGKLAGWIAVLMLAISTITGGTLAYQTLFNHSWLKGTFTLGCLRAS